MMWAGRLGGRRCSRRPAGWDFETAMLEEEKERSLWAERPRDSWRPEVSIRPTRVALDATSRRTHCTRARQCSHMHDSSSFSEV